MFSRFKGKPKPPPPPPQQQAQPAGSPFSATGAMRKMCGVSAAACTCCHDLAGIWYQNPCTKLHTGSVAAHAGTFHPEFLKPDPWRVHHNRWAAGPSALCGLPIWPQRTSAAAAARRRPCAGRQRTVSQRAAAFRCITMPLLVCQDCRSTGSCPAASCACLQTPPALHHPPEASCWTA
jgi:hypothetical protein